MPRRIKQEVGFALYVESVGTSVPKPYRTATRVADDEVRISGSVLKTIQTMGLPHRIVESGRWQGFGLAPQWVVTITPWLRYWVDRGTVYVVKSPHGGGIEYYEEEYAARIMLHRGAKLTTVLDWPAALEQIRTGNLGPALATVMNVSGQGQARPLFDLIPWKQVQARDGKARK